MMNLKNIPLKIWVNLIFFAYVIAASIGGIINRGRSSDWAQMADIRLKYDFLYGIGFSTLAVVAIVGLILRKEWGRQFSISLCLVLFFASFLMRLGVFIYYKITIQQNIIAVDPDAILMSVLSFVCLIVLFQPSTKNLYLYDNK
jgi:uncharacterized membrane protein